MRTIISLILLPTVAACSVIQSDPWEWLQKPEEQAWQKIEIKMDPVEVYLSVPDRLNWGTERPWYSEKLRKGAETLALAVQPEEEFSPHVGVLDVFWDTYWGGFYKEGDYDFSFSVEVFRSKHENDLSQLTPEERLERILEQHRDVYAGISGPSSEEYFWKNHWIKQHENANGIVFIVENNPKVTLSHQNFTIPIDNYRRLEFSFFVRDKRWSREEDPEWNKSRWDLVYKIMDTVEILPAAPTNH